jgi:hypothetical protein
MLSETVRAGPREGDIGKDTEAHPPLLAIDGVAIDPRSRVVINTGADL